VSHVTNVVVYTAIEDSAAPRFLRLLGLMSGGVSPERVSPDEFPGPKYFEGDLYAAVGNYWNTSTMQAAVDAVDWDDSAQVVVICCTEDNPARVYRPSDWRD
jgi:hypothetical protein